MCTVFTLSNVCIVNKIQTVREKEKWEKREMTETCNQLQSFDIRLFFQSISPSAIFPSSSIGIRHFWVRVMQVPYDCQRTLG